MKLIAFLFFVIATISAQAQDSSALPTAVVQDVRELMQKVLGSQAQVQFYWMNSTKNISRFECSSPNTYIFRITSSSNEASATLYYNLRKLNFLFPHPRITQYPVEAQIKSQCNKSFEWKPRLEKRGFHLHTMHPSEWVAGYFMGFDQIAEDTNRWLTRNQQNYLEVQMLQLTPLEEQNLIRTLNAARKWGLQVGLSASFGMIQQRSYNMISYFHVLTHWNDEQSLKENLTAFIQKFPLDFVTFELGSSEFTPTNPERTIQWMNIAAQILKQNNKGLYIKVHASNNQYDEKHGNFNYLPQFADPYVGILPHSTYFYGLTDTLAPMYHRKDYSDMQEFYLREAQKRPNLYYPETSYFIFMDIDAPLFLTDYLKIRTDDVDWMQDHQLTGHLNFSTGQEVGYWLMDYQVTLLTDSESRHRPLYALELLGENLQTWSMILEWQNTYLKKQQLIQTLFFSNLVDEAPFSQPVHEHIILRDLKKNRALVEKQVELLKEALKNQPSLETVKNPELKTMLEVTTLRMQHALTLRQAALLDDTAKADFDILLNSAAQIRTQAFDKMNYVFKNFNRYPEVPLTQYWKNPTSYGFGYLITSRTLQLWEREEDILKEGRINPLFKSIVNPLRILLPRSLFEFFDWF